MVMEGCIAVGAGLGCVHEGGGMRVQGRVVFGCALMRARRNGRSPVYAASYGGHLMCIQALILAKADVLQCDT